MAYEPCGCKHWARVFEICITPEQEMLEQQPALSIHLLMHTSLNWTSETASIRNAWPLEPFMDSKKMTHDSEEHREERKTQ